MAPPRRSLKRTSTRRSGRASLSKAVAAQIASELQDNEPPSATRIELLKGRMAVAVRIRPLFGQEIEQNHRRVVCALDERCLVFDPKNDFDDAEFTPRVVGSKIVATAEKNEQFDYERVFDESCDNHKVYEDTVLPLLSSFLDGYNCSVFAYGATGSGKTHTMMGHDSDKGIISLTMERLFKQLDQMGHDNVVEVQASYFEIYNENILDLLRPGKSAAKALDIRETAKNVFISGLSHHSVESMDQILELMEEGNKRRSQSETTANAKSSRSHAIFQINLKITNKATRTLQESKMSLIDLAGSERAAGVNKDKDRLKEGTNINKSLLALGNCINALAENKKLHVPYRDSKLTRILKDSLGGSAATLMIANISPAHGSYETTHKTLLYAQRARKIQIRTAKNQNKVALGGITNYKTLVNNINQQLEATQMKLKLEKQNSLRLAQEIQRLQAECEAYKNQAPSPPIPTSTDVPDRRTEELFRQYTRSRNREIEAISNLKHAQFSRLINDDHVDIEEFVKASQEAAVTKAKIEQLVAEARKKVSPDVLAPLYSQYLHDTCQREVQETQTLFSKCLRLSLGCPGSQAVDIRRFVSFDNTEEPLFTVSSKVDTHVSLNETFDKFTTPPVPLPRSILKNGGTITKQVSSSAVVSMESAERQRGSKVRRMLMRSESTRVLTDKNTGSSKKSGERHFLRKPLWK